MKTKEAIRLKLVKLLDSISSLTDSYECVSQIMLQHYKEKISQYDTIYLYGAGKYGKLAAEYLWDIIKEKNVFFIDSNKEKENKAFFLNNGVKIDCFGIEKMFGCDPDKTIIIITSIKWADSIAESLLGTLPYARLTKLQGKDKLSHTFVDRAFIKWLSINTEENIYGHNKQKLLQVFDLLEDELSLQLFYQWLLSRISGDICIKELTTYPQYFPNEILDRFTENEVFLDCGACMGDSIEEFKKYTKDKYIKIYSFEMDCDTFKKLLENPLVRDERVVPINAGVSDQNRQVHYRHETWRSSYVEGMTEYAVEADGTADLISVDSLVSNETITEKVTFVKMDIEGAETDALKGMRELIVRDKPKLAICVYHRPEDFFEIPLYIHELVPEYKLVLRSHHPYGYNWETVIYAYLE